MQYTICRSLRSRYDGIIERTYIFVLTLVSQKSFVPHLPGLRWDKTFLDSYTLHKRPHRRSTACSSQFRLAFALLSLCICRKAILFKVGRIWQVCQCWLIYTVACGPKNWWYPNLSKSYACNKRVETYPSCGIPPQS